MTSSVKNPLISAEIERGLERAGMTRAKLARLMDCSPQNVSQILKLKTGLTPERLKQICTILDMDFVRIFSQYVLEVDPYKQGVSRKVPVVRDFTELTGWDGDLRKIKLVAEEYVVDLLEREDCFVVQVTEDACVGEGISIGDLLYIDPHTRVRDGNLVICVCEECGSECPITRGFIVGRYFESGNGGIEIRPANSSYRSIFFPRHKLPRHLFKIGYIAYKPPDAVKRLG